MKGWQLNWQVYRRPLLQPLRIGAEELAERRGLWIQAIDPQGRRHIAECAPLPGLHRETLAEAVETWREWGASPASCDLGGLDLGRAYWGLLPFSPASPAVQSSLEMLLLSYILAEKPEVFPARALSKGYTLCGLLTLPELADAVWWQKLEELRKQGVRCIKVKIARLDATIERQRLIEVRAVLGPELQLRLDANQGLAPQELVDWQNFLQGWPLQYVEDPLQEFDSKLWGLPLARDEGPAAAEAPLPAAEEIVAVLKPNVIGLNRYLAFLRAAGSRSQPLVLSNAYESPLSLRLYAWLYSRYIAEPWALGLGTEAAFADRAAAASIWSIDAQGSWPAEAFGRDTFLLGLGEEKNEVL